VACKFSAARSAFRSRHDSRPDERYETAGWLVSAGYPTPKKAKYEDGLAVYTPLQDDERKSDGGELRASCAARRRSA
jgi:hypothetical protein